jgi:hypothetical protein
MLVVLTAVMTVAAQPQRQSQTQQTGTAPAAPMSVTVQTQATEKKVEIFTPLSKKLPQSKQTDKIERVDGMSSQPWSRMIGPHPGWSAFPEPEQQEPVLNVFWIGAAPK